MFLEVKGEVDMLIKKIKNLLLRCLEVLMWLLMMVKEKEVRYPESFLFMDFMCLKVFGVKLITFLRIHWP